MKVFSTAILLCGVATTLVAGQEETYSVTFSKPTTFTSANANTLFPNGVSPALPVSKFVFSAARSLDFETGQPLTNAYLTTPFSLLRSIDAYSSGFLQALTTGAKFATVNVRSSQNANKGYTFTGVQVVGYQHQKDVGAAVEHIQLSAETLQVNNPGADQARWTLKA